MLKKWNASLSLMQCLQDSQTMPNLMWKNLITKRVFTATTLKQSSNRPLGCFKMSQNPTKVNSVKSVKKSIIATFSQKLDVSTEALEN